LGPRGDSIKDGRHLATAEHHQPKKKMADIKKQLHTSTALRIAIN